MIKPLGERIVVKADEQKEEKRNGIIVPGSATEKPQEGVIVAVGKGRSLEDGTLLPLDVKVGDRILYGKYSGSEVKIDNQAYLIMSQDDVLGILD